MKFVEFKEKQEGIIHLIYNLTTLVGTHNILVSDLKRAIDELYDLHLETIEHEGVRIETITND